MKRPTFARRRSTTCARSSRPITGRATPRWRLPATSTPTTRCAGGALLRSIDAGRVRRRRSKRALTPLGREVRLLLEDRVELPRLYWPGTRRRLFARRRRRAGSRSPRSSPAARPRGSIARWSTISGSPPRSPRRRTRARSAASSRWWRPPRPAARCRSSKRRSSREIDRFVADGPTAAEMERCLAQAESHFIYRLQTVGGFGGKSDQLNAYNVFLRRSRLLRPGPRPLPAGVRGGAAGRGGAFAARRSADRAERRAARPGRPRTRRFPPVSVS